MNYNLAWGSNHPGLLVYLVDLSGSMKWDEKNKRVSNIIWNVLDYLTAGCQDMGEYRERFHLKIIGYNQYITEIFSGDIHHILDHLEKTEETKQFINTNEKKSEGLTHMATAYEEAAVIINKWINEQNTKGIPTPAPIVINITDGYPEEKNITPEQARDKALNAAQNLMNISVPDGNVLLFNIHIEGVEGKEPEIILPYTRPTDFCKGFLFDASTELNDEFITRATRSGLPASKGSHFMASNISFTTSNSSNRDLLSQLIVFGSTVSGLNSLNGRREVPIP
ncbi:MAG: VWA domain-containing protein [Bacteroidetes bacterium]|uniref:VWA domain-containing protein n=1 Tax=Candidatus Gallipaludibacter merdavium TaxID=2840839 RepID=A0A9D9N4Z5_9BACT|nr:VWA domain-containing protein [Candidatus Gallipaludibacter merdavium]